MFSVVALKVLSYNVLKKFVGHIFHYQLFCNVSCFVIVVSNLCFLLIYVGLHVCDGLFCLADLRSNLEAEVRRSMLAAWAPGTIKNMQTQFDLFVKFCSAFQYQSLPASHETLCAFMQFLSRDFESPGAIKNYVVGVKWFHVLAGMETSQFDHVSVKLVQKGIARLKKHKPKQALPLTPAILDDIHRLLNLASVNDATFWTALLFGFFLMARKSNLVPDSVKKFDSKRHLCRGDVTDSENLVLVSLKWSKTNQNQDREHGVPLLAMPESNLCPVRAFHNMMELVPGNAQDPLFQVYRSTRLVPLTYRVFQGRLRQVLSVTGREPAAYSSHSLRRGGATFAAAAGVPRHCIQQVGDWKSDAVDQYLHNPLQAKVQAAQMMRDELNCLT